MWAIFKIIKIVNVIPKLSLIVYFLELYYNTEFLNLFGSLQIHTISFHEG